jgi:hypothetical protein
MGLLGKGGCFRTKMRVCLSPKTDIWVRWFLVPRDTPFFPYPTVFHEHVYYSTNFREWPDGGIGPVGFYPRIWDEGLAPLQIAPLAGDPSWFVTGIPPGSLPP